MKAEIPITWFDSIDSTNSEARRRLPANAKMSVYAAKFQTAGRGQRGNKWSSAAGQNLTFPYLDMVSFGPTLRGVHAPGEKLDLVSNEKFVKLLVDIVTNFK